MAGLLLCAIFIWLASADTPCWCANDQVLGTWKIESTGFKYTITNDRTSCPASIRVKETRMITLLSPNVAVDEDTGASGTWSQVYSQAIQINIGDLKYLYFFGLGGCARLFYCSFHVLQVPARDGVGRETGHDAALQGLHTRHQCQASPDHS